MALAIFSPPWIEGSIGLAKSRSSSHSTLRSMQSTRREKASRVMASLSAVRAVAASLRRAEFRETRLIDGANSQRHRALESFLEQAGIGGPEALADAGDQLQGLGHRADLRLEQRCLAEGVIAADAEDEVSCVGWKGLQLAGDVGDHGAVLGAQAGADTPRRQRAQLADNIGASRDVGSVVEDGVAEQDNVFHRTHHLGGGWAREGGEHSAAEEATTIELRHNGTDGRPFRAAAGTRTSYEGIDDLSDGGDLPSWRQTGAVRPEFWAVLPRPGAECFDRVRSERPSSVSS